MTRSACCFAIAVLLVCYVPVMEKEQIILMILVIIIIMYEYYFIDRDATYALRIKQRFRKCVAYFKYENVVG